LAKNKKKGIEVDLNFQKGSDLLNYQTRGGELLRTLSIPKSNRHGTKVVLYKNLEIYSKIPEYIKNLEISKWRKMLINHDWK